MRAFIDTSTLFKKYVDEKGSRRFSKLLESISEILVAPVTVLEVHSVLERRIRDKSLTRKDAGWIEKEFLFDLNFFGVVRYNENLMKEATRVIRKYQLKVLDGIQLSSAILSQPDIFVVSDARLFAASKSELRKTEYIE